MIATCRHTIAGVFEGHATLPHGRFTVWVVPANAAVWVLAHQARLQRDGEALVGTVRVQGYRYGVRAEPDGAEMVDGRAVAVWRVEFSE